jgi:galactosamine-6-phosphate isomerase
MRIVIGSDFEAMSHAAAEDFVGMVERTGKPLLCLPSGKSPVAFLRRVRGHYARWKRLPDWFFVGLDEWIGVSQQEQGSCRHFLHEHLFGELNVPEDRISFFNGLNPDTAAECARADAFVASHKGIDVCVLGIGSNGHLGLNEPGSDRDSPTRTVSLAASTMEAAQGYFSGPRDVRTGITLGLNTLLASKTLLLLASGTGKAEIIRRALEGPVGPEVPGSFLQEHPNVIVYLDEDAARLLQKRH